MKFEMPRAIRPVDTRWLLAGFAAALLMLAVLLLSRPGTPEFSEYAAGKARKDVFFGYLLPIIQQSNEAVLQTREELLALREETPDLGYWQKRKVAKTAARYSLDGFNPDDNAHWEELLKRVDVIPASLALAQAANESAWGTSRFAREGNNFFGQWCFEPGCGLVPMGRDEGKTHEVAHFSSPRQSVERYIYNLNQHDAYRSLRDIRARLRAQEKAITGNALAAGLELYSERGPAYISELRQMIRVNQLQDFDVPARQLSAR